MSPIETARTAVESGSKADNISLDHFDRESAMPEWLTVDALAEYLHEVMKPYNDTVPDVLEGLRYALSDQPGRGGFIITASREKRLLGAIVMLDTGMSGYVPANLLLFVAVSPELRGHGLGTRLIKSAAKLCRGAVKLHVEPDNPARRLYERLGFTSKYVEMRLDNS
jgi:[ribosomal protein S18]-alanine N-acetyltransferase